MSKRPKIVGLDTIPDISPEFSQALELIEAMSGSEVDALMLSLTMSKAKRSVMWMRSCTGLIDQTGPLGFEGDWLNAANEAPNETLVVFGLSPPGMRAYAFGEVQRGHYPRMGKGVLQHFTVPDVNIKGVYSRMTDLRGSVALALAVNDPSVFGPYRPQDWDVF